MFQAGKLVRKPAPSPERILHFDPRSDFPATFRAILQVRTGDLSVAASIGPISLPNYAGINFNDILQALEAAGQVPIAGLQQEIADETASISALGKLAGDLTSLQTALSGLQSIDSSPELGAQVSAGSPCSASVTGAPAAGTYGVTVQQMAQAQASASQGYASDTDPVGTGSITVTIGKTAHTITIDDTNNTLDGVAGAINSAAIGVTAQVVNTGLPTDPYRLELVSSQTGGADAFTVSASLAGGVAPDFMNNDVGAVDYSAITGTANGASNGPLVEGSYTGAVTQGYHFSVISGGTIGSSQITIAWKSDSGGSGTITVPSNYTAAQPIPIADGLSLSFAATGGTLNTGDTFAQAAFTPSITAAQDATVQVGSQIVTSSSNSVTNAIPGLTLDLSGAGSGTVTLSENVSNEAQAVQSFVSAYNQLTQDIEAQIQVAKPGDTPPPLYANGAVQALLFQFQSALGGINLSKMGISVDNNAIQDNNGQLTFDQSTFESNILSDPTGVRAAMAQINSALSGAVSGALAPDTGLVASETSSYNSLIGEQNQQISNLQSQLQQQENQFIQESSQVQAEVAEWAGMAQLFLPSSSSGSGLSNTTGLSMLA
jgi:flagellar hook-associated protein 2